MPGTLEAVPSRYLLLLFRPRSRPPHAQLSPETFLAQRPGSNHRNDRCGFCAANQGSVEKPAARESLSTLKIYAAGLSHHPQWQVHPGDHLSKEFYEAPKFMGIAWDSEMEEIGGLVSPGRGDWAVCFWILFPG